MTIGGGATSVGTFGYSGTLFTSSAHEGFPRRRCSSSLLESVFLVFVARIRFPPFRGGGFAGSLLSRI